MSSTTWNDLTCKNNSSALSCLAMRDLAIKETEENQIYMSYLLQDPSCERYQSLANRLKEHQLQGTQLSRRLCFTHDPTLKQGPYNMHLSNGLKTQQWDQWTRRKDIGGPAPLSTTSINADVWNNMSDDASAVTKCGTGGMFKGFNLAYGIAYGPSSLDQSQVPSNLLQSLGCCNPL